MDIPNFDIYQKMRKKNPRLSIPILLQGLQGIKTYAWKTDQKLKITRVKQVSPGQTDRTVWYGDLDFVEKSGYRLYLWFFIIYSNEK